MDCEEDFMKKKNPLANGSSSSQNILCSVQYLDWEKPDLQSNIKEKY